MSAPTLARVVAGCVALASLIALPNGSGLGVAALDAQARERIAYVTLADAQSLQPVTKVAPEDLVIREDGVRREILRVAPATSPMTIALVIDNSQAAAPTIPDLRKALDTFVRRVEGLGPIGIFSVADRPTVLQTYTSSQEDLLGAVGRLFHTPGSGATLLDTITDVARGIGRRESDRAAIVVVTGENTEFSNLSYQRVLEILHESGAMMSVVVLVNPRTSLDTEEARNRAVVLDRGPRESGGARIDVLTSMSFDERLGVLAALLEAQQRVTYGRPESLIPPESFEVSAAKDGLTAFGAPARGQDKQ